MSRELLPSFLLIVGVAGMSGAADHPHAQNGSTKAETPADGRTAPLLEGMGDYTLPVSKNEKAQRYFDQGMVLMFGFNHAEAERSFLEAAKRDPDCAMAYWGAALALGPNINAVMEDDAVPRAWEHLQMAIKLRENASPPHRDYIDALEKRYVKEPVKDRSKLDAEYSAAMRKVVEKHPDDVDAMCLLAEALMDEHPWDFWQKDGTAQPWTGEIVQMLERALKAKPLHPLANHLYIHAIEASPRPERAIASADRLRTLVPGAGHLVHMPAHIYIRLGMYHDASLVNEVAIKSDNQYVTQCHAQGLYPVAYMPHNEHFLWFSATFEGRSQLAIEAAKKMAHHVDPKLMREKGYGVLQWYYVTPTLALARFGKWEEILKLPEPDADLIYPRAMWHYARGMALARTDQFDAAEKELAALATLALDKSLEKIEISGHNVASNIVPVAREQLAGELAAERGNAEKAVEHLRRAVVLEAVLNYEEPEAWHAPMKLSLAAVLLKIGQPKEAEQLYREDLLRHPDNGWALFGLMQSLKSQGRKLEAAEAQRRFDIEWSRADVKLTGSGF